MSSRLAAVCSRLQRLQGILKAVRSTAANAEDMVRAQTAVVKLQAQLTDLQRAESELSQQVDRTLTLCLQDTLRTETSMCTLCQPHEARCKAKDTALQSAHVQSLQPRNICVVEHIPSQLAQALCTRSISAGGMCGASAATRSWQLLCTRSIAQLQV